MTTDGGRPHRPRRRNDAGPRKIGESLDAVVGRLGSADASALATVFARWETIVGPRVAQHVRPLRVQEGVLVVGADHPAWATETRSLAPRILASLETVTTRPPTRLEVVVRRS